MHFLTNGLAHNAVITGPLPWQRPAFAGVQSHARGNLSTRCHTTLNGMNQVSPARDSKGAQIR